jgi:hypothetical protein
MTLALVQPAAAQYLPQYGNLNRSLGPAFQQPFGTSPALSPWLNLVRSGNPAIELYLGTLPEMDRRWFQGAVVSTLPTLENFMLQQQQAVPPDIFGIPTLPATGHGAGFGVYGTYFGPNMPQRPFYPYNPSQGRPAVTAQPVQAPTPPITPKK